MPMSTYKKPVKKRGRGRPKTGIKTKLVGLRLPLKIAKWLQTKENKPKLIAFIGSEIDKGKNKA